MNTAAKLGVFAVGLAAAFGIAAGIGAAAGPVDVGGSDEHAADGGDHGHDAPDPATPVADIGGLASVASGFSLAPERTTLDAAGGEYGFRILDESGFAVTAFDVVHERELHLVVVSRDLAGFHHLHPERDASGRWATDLPALAPGWYRVFADFQPSGGERVVLGTDLAVPGEMARPVDIPPAFLAEVDGYRVTLDRDESTLSFAIERDGAAVVTDPYLGERAHLVAIRAGDLGYLHTHPHEADPHGHGASAVDFTVEFPSAGTYHLFLEFAHEGTVHTVPFRLEVGHVHTHG